MNVTDWWIVPRVTLLYFLSGAAGMHSNASSDVNDEEGSISLCWGVGQLIVCRSMC